MKLNIIKIGKPVSDHYVELVDIFRARLKNKMDITSTIHKVSKSAEKADRDLDRLMEKNQGLSHLWVALDERGRSFSSLAFAEKIQSYLDNPQIKSVNFVIGGPYGLSEAFKNRCDLLIRLSDMVFPSDMAWLMLWEQVYRAHAILNGSPYHHA